LLSAGLVLASVAFFMYGDLDLTAGGTDFLWPQIIQGAGLSMVFTPLTTIAMDAIPLEFMGFATSLFSMARNIGSSIGISFVTTMVARRSQFHQARLSEAINPYNPALQHAMHSIGNAMGAGGDHTARTLGVIYGRVLRQASALSYLEMFHLLGGLFLLMLPLVWFMSRPSHHRTGRGASTPRAKESSATGTAPSRKVVRAGA
jgi:DHA2 family multidrug resistance protein